MKPKQMPSVQQIREALDYNPETGVLTWREGRKCAGAVAGTIHKFGYRVISFNNQLFYAHRFAWAHYTGEHPRLFIDHINGDKLDNRIINLREANYQQNARNSRPYAASGMKGVYRRNPNSNRWFAEIRIGTKNKCLGTFGSKEEAAAAFAAVALSLHGEFVRLSE